jgi:hypothetical protein
MITVLRTEIIPAIERPTLWVDDAPGYRVLMAPNDTVIATEDPGMLAAAAEYRLQIPKGNKVAVIGGGFCVLPRLLLDCQVDVYETIQELAQYVPPGANFIVGDWSTTLVDAYNVIVYDLGGEVPYAQLEPHLLTDGFILPRRS